MVIMKICVRCLLQVYLSKFKQLQSYIYSYDYKAFTDFSFCIFFE
jgi:hypothetical protein